VTRIPVADGVPGSGRVRYCSTGDPRRGRRRVVDLDPSNPGGQGRGGVPDFLTDPVAVICAVVCAAAGITAEAAERVVHDVLPARGVQRRVARLLAEDPHCLVSGVATGPSAVDRLIVALRAAGAAGLVVPVCCQCGRTGRLRSWSRDRTGRVCTSCSGTSVPCAGCGVVARVRARDQDGQPLCARCLDAERTVDHLSVIVDHLQGLRTGLGPDRLREIVLSAVPSPHRQRLLRGELDGDPCLLANHPHRGSSTAVVVAQALRTAGAGNLAPLNCPFCQQPVELTRPREGLRCCEKCYRDTYKQPCSRCGRDQRVRSRTPDGAPLCTACTRIDPANQEDCPRCGRRGRLQGTGIERRCGRCAGPPVTRCSICGQDKPCTGAGTGQPRCVACQRRARGKEACVQCGAVRTVQARGPDGPRCGTCSGPRGQCLRCGRVTRLSVRLDQGRVCDGCWRTDPAARRACLGCGTLTIPYRSGFCPACACPQILRILLGDPSPWPTQAVDTTADRLRPAARTVLAALCATDDPLRVLTWAESAPARRVLGRLASADATVSHALLDDLAAQTHAERCTDILRHTLIQAGALPVRDELLIRLQTWIDTALAAVPDAGERAALRRFVTWHHLSQLRRPTHRRPHRSPAPLPDNPTAEAGSSPARAGLSPEPALTVAQYRAVRFKVRAVIDLLTWLRQHGSTLATATQHDMDTWLSQVPDYRTQAARAFVVWATDNAHAHGITVPRTTPPRRQNVLPDTDQRWKTARRLLHDEDIDLADRVAGLLVLLYAQTPKDIADLTVDHVVVSPDPTGSSSGDHDRVAAGTPAQHPVTRADTLLQLGRDPIRLPDPVDLLVTRLVATRASRVGGPLLGSRVDLPWLFPGRNPSLPISARRLGQRLTDLGIPPREARNTALVDLGAHLPAAALSRLLGLSVLTATRWTIVAGNTRPAYAAHLATTRPRVGPG
jgi:hypothetical protein